MDSFMEVTPFRSIWLEEGLIHYPKVSGLLQTRDSLMIVSGVYTNSQREHVIISPNLRLNY